MPSRLVVVSIGSKSKVYHHPNCFVLERAVYTADSTEEKETDKRCCKICEHFYEVRWACPGCKRPMNEVRDEEGSYFLQCPNELVEIRQYHEPNP